MPNYYSLGNKIRKQARQLFRAGSTGSCSDGLHCQTEECLSLTSLTLVPMSSSLPVLLPFLSLSLIFWIKLNAEFSPSWSLALSPIVLIHIPEHPITPLEIAYPQGIIWSSNGYGSCARATRLLEKIQFAFTFVFKI